MDEYLDDDFSLGELYRRVAPTAYKLQDYEINSLRNIEESLSRQLSKEEIFDFIEYLDHLSGRIANFIVTDEKEGVDCSELRKDLEHVKALIRRLNTKLAVGNSDFLHSS